MPTLTCKKCGSILIEKERIENGKVIFRRLCCENCDSNIDSSNKKMDRKYEKSM